MAPGGEIPAEVVMNDPRRGLDAAGRAVLDALRARVAGARLAALDALSEGALIHDAAGRLTAADDRARALLGCDAAALDGSERPPARALATAERHGPATIGVRPDGERLTWLTAESVPVRDAGGAVTGVVTVLLDVTARHEADAGLRAQAEALRQANAQFSSAFAHAPIGMALVATDGRWLRVNPAICDLLGYSAEDLLAGSFQDVTHPDDLDADLAQVRELLEGRRTGYRMEKRYIRSDGRVIWAILAVSLVSGVDGAPIHFVSQVQDISERRELEVRLREQAEHDHLTGLFNRRRFEDELRRQIGRTARSGEPAMLAMIDLDRFKGVNDREGHLAGDTLLREVGAALGARLRRSDALARLGGDEFAAILVNADEEAGASIARMLVAAVRTVVGDGRDVSASVGLARIEADDDPYSALARADEALYAAKAAGRGAVRVGAEPE